MKPGNQFAHTATCSWNAPLWEKVNTLFRKFLLFLFPIVLAAILPAGKNMIAAQGLLMPQAEKLFIDGKEIKGGDDIRLLKDDSFRMKVTGLRPNSQIDLEFRFAGIKLHTETFFVDEKGESEMILTIPNFKAKAKCIARYWDRAGSRKEAEFHLKVK